MKFKLLLFWMLAGCTSISLAQKNGQPNVILIVADDLGIGDLSCYGSKWLKTPNIDRLAREGLLANDANSTSAVCTPSRYAMLSGRYYHRYPRSWNGEALIEVDRPTVASVLREHGYATAYFGKVHTGWGEPSEGRKHRQDIDWNQSLPRGVLEMGFDTYFGTPFSHNEPPYVFVEDRRVVGLDPDDPLKIAVQKEAKAMGLENWGWGASYGAQEAHAARPVKEIDRIVTDRAIAYIEQMAGKQAFFMNLAYVAPHVPTYPSEAFRGTSRLGWYGDCVEQMDWYVGRLLQALETQGILDETLIIFTSDNGAIFHWEYQEQGQASNLGLLGQKTDVWQGGVRVPFLMRWPQHIPAGTVFEPLIGLVDIPNTVWAAAGVTAPAGAAPDGLNQFELLSGQTFDPVRDELFLTGITGQGLRSGDWVYIPHQGSCGISTLESATWALQINEIGQENSDYNAAGKPIDGAPEHQLYNLRLDPAQSTNLVREHPEVAARLAKRFHSIRNHR